MGNSEDGSERNLRIAKNDADKLPENDAVRNDVQRAVEILTGFGLEAINGMDGD